jgi:hypothetical protein
MDKWFRYINEIRTNEDSRKSPKAIEKSIKTLTGLGGNTGGNPKGMKKVKDPLGDKEDEDEVSAPPGAPGGGSVGTAVEEKRNSFKNRIKTYTKDRDELLGVGGQSNTPPYTQKMGNHVTFDKQTGNIDEEVEPESFDKNDTLEPHFWQDNRLNSKVSKRLKRIVDDFVEGLDVSVDVKDIRFTGSLANYNWSRYSDVDLHIVVDFSKVDEDTELVKGYFDAERMRWNERHNIKIYGFEVEIYVENVGDVHKSSGIYSISQDKWLKEPDRTQVSVPFSTARLKSDDILTQINMIERFIDKKPESALKAIDRLKEKIRNMRRAGLESEKQEYSAENIAFKILRREETLEKLNDMKYNAYDSIMSMRLQ